MILAALGVVLVAGLAVAYGTLRWRSATRAMLERLDAGRLPVAKTNTYSQDELAGLPPAVERYFRAVLRDGQPIVTAATIQHAGSFNLSDTGERWRPFTSAQRIVTRRPGFDWEARISVAPGLAVRVHDAYVAGEGILHASLFGVVSLASLRGTPELAEGELMRFLAEAAWFPTALLPSQGVQWEAVDDRSARATLVDGTTRATLTFRFGDDGLIEFVRGVRGRTVGRAVVPTPWEGRWGRYERRDGLLIPTEGEVAWILPDGARLYWRARVTHVAYELAAP